MPFTPYHIGPSLCVALPLKRYIDLPVFIVANAIVDIEPLFISLCRPQYNAHGYCHTLLFGYFIGVIWAIVAFLGKNIFQRLMIFLRLPYKTHLPKMLFSAIMGVWFHILLDAPLYSEIRPFFPFKGNPLFGIVSLSTARWLYIMCFIPALILYLFAVRAFSKRQGFSFFSD